MTPDFCWWLTHPVSSGGADPSARSLNISLSQFRCSRAGQVPRILQQTFPVPQPGAVRTLRAAGQEGSVLQGSSGHLPGLEWQAQPTHWCHHSSGTALGTVLPWRVALSLQAMQSWQFCFLWGVSTYLSMKAEFLTELYYIIAVSSCNTPC